MSLSPTEFFEAAQEDGLTHHRPSVARLYLEQVLFRGLVLAGKTVLDIGGGAGLYSLYAACMGADSVVNVEPILDGSSSKSHDLFRQFCSRYGLDNALLLDWTIQDYMECAGSFDVVIMHDSINHLDEAAYIQLASNRRAYNLCCIIVGDC